MQKRQGGGLTTGGGMDASLSVSAAAPTCAQRTPPLALNPAFKELYNSLVKTRVYFKGYTSNKTKGGKAKMPEARLVVYYYHPYEFLDGRKQSEWYVTSDLNGLPLSSEPAALFLAGMIDKELEVERAGGERHNPLKFQAAHKNEWLFEPQIRRWLDLKEAEIATSSFKKYTGYVEKYLIPHFGQKDIKKIIKNDITLFKAAIPKLAGRILEPKTINDLLRLLAEFFNFCVDNQIIATRPKVDGVSVPEKDVPWADYETQNRVLQLVDEPHKDFVLFNMRHGIRNGEACALRVKRINFSTKPPTITIAEAMTSYGLSGTKEDSVNHIPAHVECLEMLKRHCAGKTGDAFLFTMPNGKPYKVQGLYKIVKAAIRKAGLDMAPYQLFKHSVLTQAAVRGVSTDEIVSYAGWTSAAVAKKYVNKNVRAKAAVQTTAEVVPLKTERSDKVQ